MLRAMISPRILALTLFLPCTLFAQVSPPLSLSQSELYLVAGGSATPLYRNGPSTNSSNAILNWLSGDSTIASVNKHGVVTPHAPGRTTITLVTSDSPQSVGCVVTVVPMAVVAITLDSITLALNDGETSVYLTPTIIPERTLNKAVNWASSNSQVASVDIAGKVTPLSPGTATISVTTCDQNKTARCTVTVAAVPVVDLFINKRTLSLSAGGESERLSLTFQPLNASNKMAKWSSSDTLVAVVDRQGVVKSVGAGEALIMATSVDGAQKVRCYVSVNPVFIKGGRLPSKSVVPHLRRSDDEE